MNTFVAPPDNLKISHAFNSTRHALETLKRMDGFVSCKGKKIVYNISPRYGTIFHHAAYLLDNNGYIFEYTVGKW